jgi:hypothetical protein
MNLQFKKNYILLPFRGNGWMEGCQATAHMIPPSGSAAQTLYVIPND